jgi:dynein heavy chain, axonemal
MIVGATGTGKSTVCRILAKALTDCHAEELIHPQGMYKTVKVEMLNPKAVTKGELYGESNPYTNEW